MFAGHIDHEVIDAVAEGFLALGDGEIWIGVDGTSDVDGHLGGALLEEMMMAIGRADRDHGSAELRRIDEGSIGEGALIRRERQPCEKQGSAKV